MTTAVHPRLHPAERLGYALATRPKFRRAMTYLSLTHFLALWALIAAPSATAATMATALNWTGVVDSDNVPVGAYFFSVVNTLEALTQGGPDASMFDPSSWVPWAVHSATTAISHDTVAGWLQAVASLYVFVGAMMLWLLRFALSSVWLYWLAAWARPIFEVFRAFLMNHYFYPACLAIGVAIGGFHILRGRHGLGMGIIISAFAIATLGLVLLHDPIGDLYNDNGLIAQSRGWAFGVAQAAINNGPISSGGSSGQLNHLTALLADALVREPLQLWNFGTTVDTIGTCKHAYSQAILAGAASGQSDLPAHAMAKCGAPQALTYVQNMDASVLGLGIGYLFLVLSFAVFVSYVSVSYMAVLTAALINTLFLLVAAGLAMIHGTARSRAGHRLKETGRHICYVFAYVLYLCVVAVLLLTTISPGGLADQIGMNAPLAKLILIAVLSAAATVGFWWMKRRLGDTVAHDLYHSARNTAHRVHEGYNKGKRAKDRGEDLFGKAKDLLKPPGAEGHAPGPSTTDPVPGRPAAGKPHSPRRKPPRPPSRTDSTAPGSTDPAAAPRTSAPTPAAPGAPTAAPASSSVTKSGATRATASRAGAGAAEAGAGAAEAGAAGAGAAVLAPEVVIPAALAVEAVRHKKHGSTNGRTPPQLPPPPQPRQDPTGTPNNPATRNGQRRPDTPPAGGDHPGIGSTRDSDPGPVAGRNTRR